MSETETLIQEILSPEAINDLIIDSIQDIKATDIVKLDLRKLDEAPTNFFIICTGESTTQVKAIANNICKRLRIEADLKPNHIEGQKEAKWVLVDCFNVVIHVFHPDSRSFYELEDLWSDAKRTEYDNL